MSAAPTPTRPPRPWPGELAWGGDWAADAALELEHLGFVLRDGGQPGQVPGPRLLVAFRPAPALTHFDPEEAVYWVTGKGHGRRQWLRRDDALPGDGDAPFAWGRILVSDRVPVTNQFLSFGGRLLTAPMSDGTLLAAFVSRAPIVRWAGHSQGTDALTDAIGAFFARVRVPIAYDPGVEQRFAAAPPEVLYAAFTTYSERRLAARSRLRTMQPSFASWIDRERARMCRELPAAWRDGAALLDSIDVA